MDEAAGEWHSNASSLSLTPPQMRLPLSSSSSDRSSHPAPAPEPAKIVLPDFSRALVPATMNKDACYTYVHMHQSHHADLFEEFCKDKLPNDDIYVPPDLQPINPEEEDDVVPDQHAAYGVQKATQKAREPAWKDLGLLELMARGPAANAAPKRASGGRGRGGSQYKGLPR